MASIVITASLNDTSIRQSAEKTKNIFSQVFSDLARQADQLTRRFTNSLGGDSQQALNKLHQIQEATRLRDTNAENQHQRRLAEIRQRGVQQSETIEARRSAALESIRARDASSEQRHNQRLVEIRERASARSKAIASELSSTISRLAGFAAGAFAGQSLFERVVAADRAEKALAIFEGSVEKAKARIRELREFADRTPGLTRSATIQSFQQLRADDRLTDRTRFRTIEAVGRLGSVFDIENAGQFTRNLGQIFNQGFERADIKEALGRVPIFEQILETAFGTKDGKQLRALKEAGKLTADGFFTGLSDAINNDSRFSQIQDSIGARFDKLKDRIADSFVPLGERLFTSIEPGLKGLDSLLADLSTRFQTLSPEAQNAAAGIGAVSASLVLLGPEVTAISALAIAEIVAIKQAYDENLGGLRDSVQAFIAEAKLFWANYGQSISASTREVWAFIKEYIGTTLSGLLDVARGVLALLNGEWERGLRALLDGANKLLPLLLPQFIRTGQSIVKGLIDGIVASSQTVRDTLKAIAIGALESAKIALGIKSPSREFFKIGEFTIQGFIEGARSKAQQAVQEIKEITKAIIAAATPPDIVGLLRDKERQQQELERNQDFLLGFIPKPQAGGTVPGGDIPTPKVLLDAIEALRDIPPPPPIAQEFREATGFARGFLDAIETTDDIFARFGNNVARSLGNVTGLVKNLIQSLKTLALDLAGNALQKGFANLLGGIFGGGANNQPGGNSSGGIGGFFRNFFGGNSGGLSNLFRTPSFNPTSSGVTSSSFFKQLGQLNFGISAPASITGNPASVASATRIGASAVNQATSNGGLLSRISGFGSRLFGGAGGAFLPFLGAGLGAGVGGQSGIGRLLGTVGGGAIGLGLSYGASVFSALGGGFGALGPAALAALGPIALIGAPLLVGALLLGKAKQRKKDEQASGDSLQRAVDAIRALKRDVIGDRVIGESAARGVFNDNILAQFISEISQLKSKSVRESRLRNQVPDLRRLFEAEVIPELLKQATRQIVNSKLIPEFATGIFGTKAGLAFLHDGEAVLNRTHQARLVAMTNPAIFNQIGVPKAPAVAPSGVQSFERGGFYTPSNGGSLQPIVVKVDNVTLAVTEDQSAQFIAQGVSTSDGRDAVFNAVRIAGRQ